MGTHRRITKSERKRQVQRMMEQEQVIARIKELGQRILPGGASLWLYGSRARGDARPDSDYDLLILLDKKQITGADHDSYSYPLREMGWDMGEAISPHIYPREAWEQWEYVPFHDNVEQDKIVLQ